MALIMEYTNRFGDIRSTGYIVISNITDMKFEETYNVQLQYFPNKQIRIDNNNMYEKVDSVEINGDNYDVVKAQIEAGNMYAVMYNYIKTLDKYKNAVDDL